MSATLLLVHGALVFLANVKLLTLVNDHLLQLPLAGGPLQDLLVDGVGCDQAVHHHWFGLADAVTAVLSLQVCLRVLRKKKSTLSSNTAHLKLVGEIWKDCW